MSSTQNRADSSLLWDCFTNWSSTLEKTTEQQAPAKNRQRQK